MSTASGWTRVLLQEFLVIWYKAHRDNDLRAREPSHEPSATVQMASFHSRGHPVRGSMVPPVCLELSRRGGAHAGGRHTRRGHHDISPDATLRSGAGGAG